MSHDSRYFSTTKKGEIHELKEELNAPYRERRKDAVKKVIAAMTVGKDVSSLFTDVLNCMQTEDLELKKLVYLYLINYAKSQPDLAILAVNTFVKDSQDPNPLIRALAVRTMGCIRVDRITEYLCDPLDRCLKDDDPYVRKTSAICVAKLFDINAELVEDRGFLEILREMISDPNPMVVANAIAALCEIQESSSKNIFTLTGGIVFKLLAALNECNEWGQVFILDCVARYTPKDGREAENVVERITPRLQHANSAVVLSAVKVIMLQMDHIMNEELLRMLCKKMSPPLVTLLSSEPEIQYVALRNINIIVQKRPNVLSHEIKVFFCKYNDPVYVKMEKLEIMIRLASERNIDQVLLEFKEYATEVDVDFVRKSVRAIGQCAVKIEKAAERCIHVLLDLIKIKVNYVVQEAIVVIKDVFRKYPNRYESIIATLCENLDTLDEPEAKAAMIWIIGEYAERIDNASELLESFLEGFSEETEMVQLQLLTACVKIFLKKPTEKTQAMIQSVLGNATQESDNPDLRDRAFIYWRLLSNDPDAAKDVVLAEKQVISTDQSSGGMESSLLDSLIQQVATLSSIYRKPPSAFLSKAKVVVPPLRRDGRGAVRGGRGEEERGDKEGAPSTSQVNSTAKPAAPVADLLGDLMSLDDEPQAGSAADSSSPPPSSLPIILPSSSGQGLQVRGRMERAGEGLVSYRVCFENVSAEAALDGFMMQLNKNSFGLAAPPGVLPVGSLAKGASSSLDLSLSLFQNLLPPTSAPSSTLQIALKNNQQPVFYFTDKIPIYAFFSEQGRMERSAFLELWKGIPDTNEVGKEFPSLVISSADSASEKLSAKNLYYVAKRNLKDSSQEILYLSAKVLGSTPSSESSMIPLLVELTYKPGTAMVKAAVKTTKLEYGNMFLECLEDGPRNIFA